MFTGERESLPRPEGKENHMDASQVTFDVIAAPEGKYVFRANNIPAPEMQTAAERHENGLALLGAFRAFLSGHPEFTVDGDMEKLEEFCILTGGFGNLWMQGADNKSLATRFDDAPNAPLTEEEQDNMDILDEAMAPIARQHDPAHGLISANEAAGIIGVSPARVRALIAAGHLEAEQVGRTYVLKQEVARRFERGQRGKRRG